VLKVQPLGGVRACLRIAEQIGLPVVVSSALETSVGIAPGLSWRWRQPSPSCRTPAAWRRSAPLAFALHRADAEGRLRLHVRIDERTAGFLALGLAKASGRPVPVVTTSGTAAVNLHPAVVEASHAGVPLLALTADRPPELRGVGANQTIDQLRLYGGAVVLFVDVPAPDDRVGQVAQWRSIAGRALAALHSGPVHLNVPLRDPLVPDGSDEWVEPLVAGVEHRPWLHQTDVVDPLLLPPGPRTVVVAGDGSPAAARWVAEAGSWPLLAEPTSGVRSGPNALATYRLLLEHLGADIERVVVFGRPTLSRPVTRLLTRADVEVVLVRGPGAAPTMGRTDAVLTLAVAPGWVRPAAPRAEPDEWLRRWLDADAVVQKVVAAILDADFSGPAIARAVAGSLAPGGLLVVGSSASIRDLDLADPWDDALPDSGGGPTPADRRLADHRLVDHRLVDQRLVLANRGAAGIDGTVSTAVGAALAHGGDAFALLGDLTFLHDSTGLVIGPGEPRPDLTIVVNNDDGGGIFGQLEPGEAEFAGPFERLFGTSHGVDLAALCAATGTAHRLATSTTALAEALQPGSLGGIGVVEVRTDRSLRRDLDRRMREAVADALSR
jgi:2-succinyl-5-enolpyruvyl-6-hydroxy-3-cyclohexene-1-carboxylate synthase